MSKNVEECEKQSERGSGMFTMPQHGFPTETSKNNYSFFKLTTKLWLIFVFFKKSLQNFYEQMRKNKADKFNKVL